MTVCSLALDFSLDVLRSGVLSSGKAPLSVAGGQHAPGISRPAELAGRAQPDSVQPGNVLGRACLFLWLGRIRLGPLAQMSQPLFWGPVFLEASFGDVSGISERYLPLHLAFLSCRTRRAQQTRLSWH